MPTCPHCQRDILLDSLYCTHCGQPVNLSPPPPEEVREIPPPGEELQLGEYLKTGWELFKQYPLGFMGFTLLYFVIAMVMRAVPAVGWLAFFLAHTPLAAGFFGVHGRLLSRQPVEFSHFFLGFRSNRLIPLVLLGLVSQVLVTLGFLLLIAPGVYLAVGYLFAPLFILDRERDFWAAMEDSRKAVSRRWFGFFGFTLLLVLVNMAGALFLGLGLLVTVPLSYGAVTAAYARIFGLKSTFF